METKEIKVEKSLFVYVAIDGTEFNDKEQCQQYEKSAICVVKSRIKAMAIKTSNESALFNTGSDENAVYVIVPKSSEDIDRIKMFLIACNEKRLVDKATDELIGKIVLLTEGYESEWADFTTLDKMVEQITDGKFALAEK